MATSRWKVMAGVLGVSLGGLAALAGQSPKVGETRRAQPPALPDLPAPPVVKSAGAPTLEVPPPAGLPALPILPTTPAANPPAPLPIILSEPPVAAAKKPTPKPEVIPASGTSLPVPTPVVPASGSTPAPLTIDTPPSKPLPAPTVPAPAAPVDVKPMLPEPAKSLPPTEPSLPTGFTPPAPPAATLTPPAPTATVVEPAAARSAPPAAVVAAVTKFRIILRVGEGEPTFEVRTGDDMVMKVLCEKVDIASAEKGQPMQQVKASGKVRFVGFGSEGTCDELSFLAGTGELQLAVNVTIQVKDKLGRVDSELKSDKVKYKLDASAMPGVMKP